MQKDNSNKKTKTKIRHLVYPQQIEHHWRASIVRGEEHKKAMTIITHLHKKEGGKNHVGRSYIYKIIDINEEYYNIKKA